MIGNTFIMAYAYQLKSLPLMCLAIIATGMYAYGYYKWGKKYKKFHSNYYIATKNNNGDWIHSEVPKCISQYIRQLEACIRNPKESNLKEKYPFLKYPIRNDLPRNPETN